MNLERKAKIVLILIGVIIVGYAIFNQLFYQQPTPPVVIEPETPDETSEIPLPPNSGSFDGLYVETIPYVDLSNEVKLVHQTSQAFTNPLSIYEWEELSMPVYNKANYSFVQLNNIALDLYQKIDIEKDEISCSSLDQDDWRVVVCDFEQGYIEALQDGSFYIILHNSEEVKIESYEVDYIENIIEESWLKDVIPWDEYEVVLEMTHYDSFNQEIHDISIVEKTDDYYKEKLVLNFSYQHSSIVGVSKTPNRKTKIMDVQIVSKDDIEGLLKANAYYSTIVDETNFDEIELLGYELTYDSSTYKNAIIPTIHVLTTSSIDSYVNCFETDGIVIHPLKIIGTSKLYIRVR